jgi:hypothetical protein
MQVLAIGASWPRTGGTGTLRAALGQLGFKYFYHGFSVVNRPENNTVWHPLRLK